MPQQPAARRRTREDWGTAPDAPTQSVPGWEDAVRAFLRDSRARNCTSATISNYNVYLLGPRAQQFVADNHITHVSQVTALMLRDFQADLLDAGLSAGTAATFHRIVRNFLGFCHREGWDVPPATLLASAPKQPVIEPAAFTEDEERRLLSSAQTPRDRFLLSFMLHTGLRLAEVANVTLDDIVEGPGGAYVRVRQGKGKKDRIVPLDTHDKKFSIAVRSYVKNVRPTATKTRALFLQSRESTPGGYEALRPSGIQMIIKRLADDTGIHAYAHKFRHTFATRALQAGVDSLVLQRALGHTTLAMVNRYVHFNATDLMEAWAARRD